MPFRSSRTRSARLGWAVAALIASLAVLLLLAPAGRADGGPIVTGVSPDAGTLTGNPAVTVSGSGFTGATEVDFGTAAATPISVSDTTITVDPPDTTTAATVDVTVIANGVQSAVNPPYDQFTYGPPTVTSVTPSAGPVAGGSTVNIVGTGFTIDSTVEFGMSGFEPATLNPDGSLTAPVPLAVAAGTVDVVVSTPGGTSSLSSADKYTYDPVPTVTSVTPSAGPLTGDNTVNIVGTGFTNDSTVEFGTSGFEPATLNADGSLTAVAPAASAGTVNVVVSTPGGTSNAVQYTYDPVPTVTSISPSAGPVAGANTVNIVGTGFTSDSTVEFGTSGFEPATLNADGSLTAVAPAASAGTVDVVVSTPGGTSPLSTADKYTYDPPPMIENISPPSGPLDGGNSVTIAGVGLSGATAVSFGSEPASSITANGDGSITVTVPSRGSAGVVYVTVTTPGGTSPTGGSAEYYYTSTPAVTGVSPNAGPLTAGTSVTISGTGFSGATSVDFGTTPAVSYTLNSDSSITAIAPADPSGGTVNVIVTTASGGSSPPATADEFTYDPIPSVSSVNPSAGPTAGGTSVTITGTGFASGATVSFGGTAATSVTIDSSTKLTALVPAAAVAGTVNVIVSTPGGPSAISSADQYTYDPQPTVTGIGPNAGPLAGGTVVTITGTGFTSGATVSFGATAATSVTFTSSTQLIATSPGGSGTVNIQVTTPGGTSAASGADQFTYDSIPTVTSVGPSAGPIAGGTIVIINGTGFTSSSTVSFGSVAGTSVTFVSATQLTVISPAQAAGKVDITVTTPGGTSSTSAADKYTYDPVPTVTSVTPNAGPVAGETLVTVAGTGFTPGATVAFGTAMVTALTVSGSGNQLTAIVPAGGLGTVDVTVTTPGGTSATSPLDHYIYDPVPIVTSISPNAGPLGGGTSKTPVTINGSGFTSGATVMFGSQLGTSVSYVSPTQLTAVAPPEASGSVDVTVKTPGGTSATSSADTFLYTSDPTVSGVSPSAGPLTGGGTVTISGSGFTGSITVEFVSSAGTDFAATGVVVRSSTQLTATVPSLPAGNPGGTFNIVVSNAAGASLTSSADDYTYQPPPSVMLVSPPAGPTAGGTAVTISGSGFTSTSTVSFGSVPAPVTFVSSNKLTATAPAQSAGTVDITVSTIGGTSAISPADQYTYDPAPAVTGVTPDAGPVSGGSSVTITGTGFTSGATVSFGGAAATSVHFTSSTQLTAAVPAGAAPGTVDVIVVSPGGISSPSSADVYTYDAAPSVFSISPSAGTPAGGGSITIVGAGFTGGTTVSFGTIPSPSVTVTSGTSLTAIIPAAPSASTVDVTVTTPGGTSATSAADEYTYLTSASMPAPVPQLASISPSAGPLSGGTTVTIDGSHFTGASGVSFGGSAAVSFHVESDTQIVAVPPAHAGGRVDVTVTGPAGTSATTSADGFTFAPAPAVSAVRVGTNSPSRTVLTATVNDGGIPVTGCAFQYSRTTRYGSSARCSTLPASSGDVVSVTASLKRLAPATVYHFRLQVTTAAGTVASGDGRFMTRQLPLLEAPLIGLVVQQSSGNAGIIGHLLGIDGIEHGVAGESIALRCLTGCSHKTVLTLKHLKPPLDRIKVTLAHALPLSSASRVEVRVSKPGDRGRFGVYAFAPAASSLSIQLVQTGCLSSGGKTVSCSAPGARPRNDAAEAIRLAVRSRY